MKLLRACDAHLHPPTPSPSQSLKERRQPGTMQRRLDLEPGDPGASPHSALNCLCVQVRVTWPLWAPVHSSFTLGLLWENAGTCKGPSIQEWFKISTVINVVGSCPGEPMEGRLRFPVSHERPWQGPGCPVTPCPQQSWRWSEACLLQPAVEPQWAAVSWGRRTRGAPGTGQGEARLGFLLFYPEAACLAPCLALTAGDAGVNGTAKTPPALPRCTLGTLPWGPSGVV